MTVWTGRNPRADGVWLDREPTKRRINNNIENRRTCRHEDQTGPRPIRGKQSTCKISILENALSGLTCYE